MPHCDCFFHVEEVLLGVKIHFFLAYFERRGRAKLGTIIGQSGNLIWVGTWFNLVNSDGNEGPLFPEIMCKSSCPYHLGRRKELLDYIVCTANTKRCTNLRRLGLRFQWQPKLFSLMYIRTMKYGLVNSISDSFSLFFCLHCLHQFYSIMIDEVMKWKHLVRDAQPVLDILATLVQQKLPKDT